MKKKSTNDNKAAEFLFLALGCFLMVFLWTNTTYAKAIGDPCFANDFQPSDCGSPLICYRHKCAYPTCQNQKIGDTCEGNGMCVSAGNAVTPYGMACLLSSGSCSGSEGSDCNTNIGTPGKCHKGLCFRDSDYCGIFTCETSGNKCTGSAPYQGPDGTCYVSKEEYCKLANDPDRNICPTSGGGGGGESSLSPNDTPCVNDDECQSGFCQELSGGFKECKSRNGDGGGGTCTYRDDDGTCYATKAAYCDAVDDQEVCGNGGGSGDDGGSSTGGNGTGSSGSDTIPGSTEAGGIIQCGRGGQGMCTLCDLIAGLNTVIQYIMKIAIGIALAAFTIAGVTYIISAGDSGLAEMAKNAMKNAVIGFVVVFGAWVIINTTLRVIGARSDLGMNVAGWGQFDCSAR